MIRSFTEVCLESIFLSTHRRSLRDTLLNSRPTRAGVCLSAIIALICLSAASVAAVDINSCTVIAAPGTYTLTTNITDSSATNCIAITSSNVTLEGGWHQIDGVGTSGTHGVHVYSPSGRLSNVVIRNLIVRDWYVGIYFQNVDYGTIESSTVRYNQYSGIHLAGSDYNTVTQSTVNTNNTFGILLNGGSNENTLAGNTINDQGQGIQVGTYGSLASNNTIRNNSIGGNKYGIDVDSSDFLVIEDNTCTYNWYGIYLYGTTDSTITRNTITDNGYEGQYAGIFLMYAQNNLIYNNLFDNYQNFEFGGGPLIYANTWNIAKQAGPNILGGPYLGGNYWGDYYGWGSGPSNDCADSDGDYICDNSYALESSNADNLPLKAFPDRDGDGVADGDDNCWNVSNPGQANSDSDDFGDACDNCWYVDNNDQADTDNNCPDPPYAVDPLCGDVCEISDTDRDGVADADDNCPLVPNPGQENSDTDDVGDACDNCRDVFNPDQNNWDGDNLGNACDNCWQIANPDQGDADGDCANSSPPYPSDPLCGDDCDGCPNDPDKIFAGVCGCGVPDTDSDGDGTPDCVDGCPDDRGKTEPGICGCGVPDTDADSDGYVYCNDNCPDIRNDQTDTDTDGLGDVCDNCRDVPNADQQADSDNDGVGDVCDNCPATPNGQSPIPGVCITGEVGKICWYNSDCGPAGAGACEPAPRGGTCVGSGILCVTNAACGPDGECIMSQVDSDADGAGDACDADDDNDGMLDAADNCRVTPNGPAEGTCIAIRGSCLRNRIGSPCVNNVDCASGAFCSKNAEDTDGDGVGDACNDAVDLDGDEWADGGDNCPDFCNPYQDDLNNDGVGDACEFDLTVTGIEITQAVQNLNNSLPLVYGKDIWVRVYFDVGNAQVPLGPVSGTIRFFDASDLPIYTFVNGAAQNVTVYSDNSITAPAVPDRARLGDTLNFLIPGNWRWATTPYMRITISYTGTLEDISPWNNLYGPVPLEFDASSQVLNVVYVPVRVRQADGTYCDAPDHNDFWETAEWVEKVYPISRIESWHTAVLSFDDDPTTDDGSIALLKQVEKMHGRYDDPVAGMKYFGLVCKDVDLYMAGVVGRGYRPGDEAWAVRTNSYDRFGLPAGPSTFGGHLMAHEVGHNFNRMHAPSRGDANCGDPDPDSIGPNYDDIDYAPGIGEFGFDG
ncbi:MAG: right-handed parallel beta-helix repeat-containing protein, partial [Desulfobacterales bacterium]